MSIGQCVRALNLAIGPCISSMHIIPSQENSHVVQVPITSPQLRQHHDGGALNGMALSVSAVGDESKCSMISAGEHQCLGTAGEQRRHLDS